MKPFAVPQISSDPLTTFLPLDPIKDNKPRQVPDALVSFVEPTPPPRPECVAWSPALAHSLGWSEAFCSSQLFLDWMSGTSLPPGCRSFATNYGGHQFGHWAGQLGDGRAIHLGRTTCKDDVSTIFGLPSAHKSAALQLKGAGITPYARRADGLAVLRSSLREYVCSEAMSALGIPTTRALSLTLTGQGVMRDPLYDGNIVQEPGAIVCRVAPSFFRFGHLELLHYRGQHDTLKQLLDYIIQTETSTTQQQPSTPQAEQERILQWFELTAERTLSTVMHWMRVGFVHGVMNTDNFSTLGLTIDYGPFGFLTAFDPFWTPNTSDLPGRRYAYGNQVEIAIWNILRLAESLRTMVKNVAPLNERLKIISEQAQSSWRAMWQRKLGLVSTFDRTSFNTLLQELFDLLQASPLDFTYFFRFLSEIDIHTISAPEQNTQQAFQWLSQLPWFKGYFWADTEEFKKQALPLAMQCYQWLMAYKQIAESNRVDQCARRKLMKQENPVIVPRHHLLQKTIKSIESEHDLKPLQELMHALSTPYQIVNDFKANFYDPPCSYQPHQADLSCSS